MKSKEARWPYYVLISAMILVSLFVLRYAIQVFHPPEISSIVADDLGKGEAVEDVVAPISDVSCTFFLYEAENLTEAKWESCVAAYKGDRIKWDMKVEDVMTVGTGRFVLKAAWEDPDGHFEHCGLSVQCAISRTLARDLSKGERIVVEGIIAGIFKGEAFGYTAVAVALEENATVIPR